MRSQRYPSLVFGAVLVLVTVSCIGEDGSPTATGTGDGSIAAPQEVAFVAVDYAYPEAPAEIAAGVVDLTFENRGTVYHEASLTGIGDTPLEVFIQDLAGRGGLNGAAPYPDYIDQAAVPPFVSIPGGSTGHATFILTPGRYALWCSVTEAADGDEEGVHYQKGMMRELTVVGDEAPATLPEADGRITARDYAFEVDVQAGDHTVNFINEGPDQIHLSTVEVYPEGVDAEEAAAAYAAHLEPGPLPEGLPSPTGLGFSGIFSEGLGSTFELSDGGEFESGRTYLFACVVRDREGGKPHQSAYGMYKIVTIE